MSEDKEIIDNTNGKNIKYKIKKELGKGAFGKCFLFECLKDNKEYAGKIISKEKLIKYESKKINKEEDEIIDNYKKNIYSEIRIHQRLNHSNIVRLHKTFEDNDNLYILLEYCKNSDLEIILKKRKHLKEIEVQYYINELIKALKYLHLNEKLIHRDLKPQNIFLTENMEVKVGDFGLALEINEKEEEKLNDICGTLNYIAPEIYTRKYSYEVDIWSLGIIMYQLIYGQTPFNIKKNNKEDIKKLINKNYDFPEDIRISPCAKDLIKQILEPDPERRPSLDQILTHDFFNLGKEIPMSLPSYTNKDSPTLSYIRSYMPEADDDGIVNRPCSTTKLVNIIEEDNDEEKKNEKEEEKNLIGVKTWIRKYNCYNKHHSYLLNNGYYGILYKKNKILLKPDLKNIIYYDKDNTKSEYEYNNIPNNLKELQEEYDMFINLKDKLKVEDNNFIEKEEDIYLIDFKKNDDIKIFLFNNYDLQFIFNKDSTEILFSKENEVITYVNLNKQRINYSINRIKEEINNNYELKKRYEICEKYIKMVIDNKKS